MTHRDYKALYRDVYKNTTKFLWKWSVQRKILNIKGNTAIQHNPVDCEPLTHMTKRKLIINLHGKYKYQTTQWFSQGEFSIHVYTEMWSWDMQHRGYRLFGSISTGGILFLFIIKYKFSPIARFILNKGIPHTHTHTPRHFTRVS